LTEDCLRLASFFRRPIESTPLPIVESAKPSSPLPYELMLQILRHPTLSPSDRVNCCLVSKLYLDDVRDSLYHHLSIKCREVESEDGGDNVWVYTESTISLLNNLRLSIRNRELVRSIKFSTIDLYDYDEEEEDGKSGIEVLPAHVVSNFLKLCTLAEEVQLYVEPEWENDSLDAAIKVGSDRLTRIALGGVKSWGYLKMLSQTTKLRSLRLDDLPNSTTIKALPSLVHLTTLSVPTVRPTNWPALANISFTILDHLCIGLEALPQVFSFELPRLKSLTIQMPTTEIEAQIDTFKPSASFWKTFIKSIKLQVLVFEAKDHRWLNKEVKDALFQGVGISRHLPHSLRRLGFAMKWAPLDFLVDFIPKSSIKELAIEVPIEDTTGVEERCKALAPVCEQYEIHLIRVSQVLVSFSPDLHNN
jgi:hypothetical protein